MSVIETAAVAMGAGILVGGALGLALMLSSEPVTGTASYMDRPQIWLTILSCALAHLGCAGVLWGLGVPWIPILLINLGLLGLYANSILYFRRRWRHGHRRFHVERIWLEDVLNAIGFSVGVALIVLAVILL